MEAVILLIALHWRKVLAVVAIALLLGGARDANSETLAGRASVIDGDTIEISGERIRFNGIDAPESQQLCQDAKGRDYRCGQAAAKSLADFLAISRPTRCEFIERDQYGRFVGDCYRADGQSVSAWLVRNGHALDWTRYSGGAYAADQNAAKSERKGLWVGAFTPPWEWRAQKKAPVAAADPVAPSSDSCRIKGNISKKGDKIYHMPGQADYTKTRITERSGERWFCSERDAQSAGWRRARR